MNVTIDSDVRISATELFGGQLGEALQHPTIKRILATAISKENFSFKDGVLKGKGEFGEEVVLDPANDIRPEDIQPLYTVVDTYTSSNGKFSQIWGNVAIVDCQWFLYNVLDAIEEIVNEMPPWKQPERHLYKELIK